MLIHSNGADCGQWNALAVAVLPLKHHVSITDLDNDALVVNGGTLASCGDHCRTAD